MYVKPVATHAPVKFLHPDGLDGGRTVVVFGSGRGGTSAISALLRELGVAFPENSHPLKHESTPIAPSDGDVDRDRTLENIVRLDRQHDVWGWKMPADLFRVHQFASMLRRPHVVVVLRNMMDVITSTAFHEDIDWPAQAQHVGDVHAALGRFITFSPLPKAVVSYERMMQRPSETAEAFAEWLGLTPSDEQIERAAAIVSDRGYKPVAAYEGDAWQGISVSDIAADKSFAQVNVYGVLAPALEHAAALLEADNQRAQAAVRHLRDRLGPKAADTDLTDIVGPAAPAEPGEPPSSPDAAEFAERYFAARDKMTTAARIRAETQYELDRLDYLTRVPDLAPEG